MGVYINPSNETKEKFLAREGKLVFPFGEKQAITDDEVLVCLVDNSNFTAAAVVVTQMDYEDFMDPNDVRPKTWYLLKKTQLKNVIGSDFNRCFPELV